MKALHFIYNGFSEYEVALACALLASKGELLTASLNQEDVVGEGQFHLCAGTDFTRAQPTDYDLLLISGMLDAKPHWESHQLFKKIAEFDANGKTIAAICGGPLLLAKAGVLKGKKYTCGIPAEGRKEAGLFEDAEFVDKNVVTDKNLVTAKGFATVEFALAIGDKLDLFGEGERHKFESFWRSK